MRKKLKHKPLNIISWVVGLCLLITTGAVCYRGYEETYRCGPIIADAFWSPYFFHQGAIDYSENVVIGRVEEKTGQRRQQIPSTQSYYSVSLVRVLKGSEQFPQQFEVAMDGIEGCLVNEIELLQPGEDYVLYLNSPVEGRYYIQLEYLITPEEKEVLHSTADLRKLLGEPEQDAEYKRAKESGSFDRFS